MAEASTKQEKPKTVQKTSQYWEGTGRRKTSVARVRVWRADKNSYKVNGSAIDTHFQDLEQRKLIEQPLLHSGLEFDVSVIVRGGGKHSQAEAVRHGIARALVEYDSELRAQMKPLGFLKRDPRKRERQKFGLKRARRARQWRKR